MFNCKSLILKKLDFLLEHQRASPKLFTSDSLTNLKEKLEEPRKDKNFSNSNRQTPPENDQTFDPKRSSLAEASVYEYLPTLKAKPTNFRDKITLFESRNFTHDKCDSCGNHLDDRKRKYQRFGL